MRKRQLKKIWTQFRSGRQYRARTLRRFNDIHNKKFRKNVKRMTSNLIEGFNKAALAFQDFSVEAEKAGKQISQYFERH